MDFVIHAAVGGSMSASNFGIEGGWAGTRTTSALVSKFVNASDVRALFYTNGQTEDIADFTIFNDGYAITKFTNLTFAGGPSPSGAPDFVDTDMPIFRLADVYLMYAEAFLRGAGSASAATALNYLNSVITRANNGSTANNYNTLTAGSANDLQFILDERARELYWEGHRRTDLIRFGQFGGGTYIWPWKGDVAAGTATAADGHLNILPIPASDLAVNPNLKQNPGYN
jgi:starch-binding outer membrane protein, SusD/RagB family